MTQTKTKIAMIDDHTLIVEILAKVIDSLDGFTVSLTARNGKDFIEKLKIYGVPDVVLLDINMPVMNGYETITWIKKNKPEIKIITLSMFDPGAMMHLIKDDVKGFLKKDVQLEDLKQALVCVLTNGVYCSSTVTSKLFNMVQKHSFKSSQWGTEIMNETEIIFLRNISTDMTYKEIAAKMHVSPRTVDNYRDQLFAKLGVSSRVGLLRFAIKSGIVTIDY